MHLLLQLKGLAKQLPSVLHLEDLLQQLHQSDLPCAAHTVPYLPWVG